MKKLITLFSLATIFIASCSKDQKVVNNLEGDWKVTSIIENGVASPDSIFAGTKYTFEKCKVKKENCPGTISESGKSLAFTYGISEKGTKITIYFLGLGTTGEIIENTKTKFRWKTTDNGDTQETTIEKI